MNVGCKHGKVDKKVAYYVEIPKFLIKGHIKVPKCLLSWFFFMMTSTAIISTQIYNVKMTSSKNITTSKVRKHIANMVLNVDFMTSNILNMVFFFTILKFMMNLKAPCKESFKKSLIYCTFSLF